MSNLGIRCSPLSRDECLIIFINTIQKMASPLTKSTQSVGDAQLTITMKKIQLSGTPKDIGFQHGELLKDQIHHTLSSYKEWFLIHLESENNVLDAAKSFKKLIGEYNPDYITEIDHIALGAEVKEPLWLYALNSRTELVVPQKNECTALVFPLHNIIGQTWDWAQFLEGQFAVMEIEFQSGHKILQLTEAGMIGKIGMNNQGLGLTLNLIRIQDRELKGVPVHIVLRAILESTDIDSAFAEIRRSGNGKASSVILSQTGNSVIVEFIGTETHQKVIDESFYVHTNHYLYAPGSIKVAEDSYIDSVYRYSKATDLGKRIRDYTMDEMIKILSDRSNLEYPILADFEPYSLVGSCGTLATVVMDLENACMKIRVGNPSSSVFEFDDFISFDLE